MSSRLAFSPGGILYSSAVSFINNKIPHEKFGMTQRYIAQKELVMKTDSIIKYLFQF